MSRPCSVCLHPRREEAENLLRQGLSIRRSAKEIGVGRRCIGIGDGMWPIENGEFRHGSR